MSADGSVTLAWGDGEYQFRLRIKELRELEEKRNAGSFEIWMRLTGTAFRIDDLLEVLRLGLIGGGMQRLLADGMVAKYVLPGTLLDNATIASKVLREAVAGSETDAVGKWIAARLMDAQNSPNTSEPAPQWDGPSMPSTDARSGNLLQPARAGDDATVPAMNGRQA